MNRHRHFIQQQQLRLKKVCRQFRYRLYDPEKKEIYRV